MNKKMKKDVKLSPSAIIAVGFLLLILTATLLLMLPISAQSRQSTPLLTSLFTATSAVCVTGQALVDTGTHWSLFGQVVLIVAIQIGGLGVMTLMALVSMALGKRIGLRQRTLLQESVASFQVGGIAARNLLGTDAPVGRLRGTVHDCGVERVPVLVTYHPAYLLRQPEEKAKAWQDLQLAARLLRGGA